MWRLGKSRAGLESSRAWAVLLLAAPPLVWSCGGASEKAPGSTGVAGSPSGGTSSVAGSPGSTQGGSAAGGKVANGGAAGGTVQGGQAQGAHAGQATAGATGAEAGASIGGSDAGAGGATEQWPPELLGFECDSQRCSVGQACVRCISGDTASRKCVPRPAADPAGYAAAISACEEPRSTSFNECDGPEDCPAPQHCVAAEGAEGFMRCRDEPSTATFCCFTCGALTDCNLCRSNADCPDPTVCKLAQGAPPGVMGCHRL